MGVDFIGCAFAGLPLEEVDLAIIGSPDLEEFLEMGEDEPRFKKWRKANSGFRDLVIFQIDCYNDDEPYIGFDLGGGCLNYGDFVNEWPSDWRKRVEKLETLFKRRPTIFLANSMQ